MEKSFLNIFLIENNFHEIKLQKKKKNWYCYTCNDYKYLDNYNYGEI